MQQLDGFEKRRQVEKRQVVSALADEKDWIVILGNENNFPSFLFQILPISYMLLRAWAWKMDMLL